MMTPLAIFIGGGLGAVTRWLVSRALPGTTLPWGTLVVNVAGCFALGMLMPLLGNRGSPAMRAGLTTGVLGGLTTFSTFGVETVRAWQVSPQLGLLNLGLNLGLGLAAAALGLYIGGRLV